MSADGGVVRRLVGSLPRRASLSVVDCRRSVAETGVKRIRFHGLLDDEMSTVLPNGQYSFLNIFKSFDFLVSLGVAPLVELVRRRSERSSRTR